MLIACAEEQRVNCPLRNLTRLQSEASAVEGRQGQGPAPSERWPCGLRYCGDDAGAGAGVGAMDVTDTDGDDEGHK